MILSKLTARCFLVLACAACVQAQTPPLDTTTFIVMGEGLSAGMANFGLSSIVQNTSFPAQIAAKMNTAFPQPLIQPPGIGDIVGYPGQEVRLQTYPQGSVRQFYSLPNTQATSPTLFVLNLSVPGLTLSDSLSMRPVLPIAQRNMKQSVFNLILGFPQLFLDNVPLWSQFEYAKAIFPTVAMIELGYYEALDATFSADGTKIPDPTTFGTSYGTIVSGLRGLQSQVIATTIPNPLDTAGFSSVTSAAAAVQAVPFVLTTAYNLKTGDYVTRNGLLAIANQLMSGQIGPLPAGSILPAATATDITNRINALNAQINTVAKANNAFVYDLNAFMHSVRVNGATAATKAITADYLGGFYSMDGIYPSSTGHALIANDILKFLNTTYQRSFSQVDISAVAANDTLIQVKRPQGVIHTMRSLGLREPSK